MADQNTHLPPRKSNSNCCIVGCSNTYAKSPDVRFFKFPHEVKHCLKREHWIQAVNRLNKDGSTWKPTKHSRVCSSHFLNNETSNDPNSPSFVPTIFSNVFLEKNENNGQKIARFEREKPHKCELCDKSFSCRKTLKVHHRVHTGENRLKCEICLKSFSGLTNLKVHHRVHTGEKPHKCDVCHKSFSRLENLKVHRQIHSGEKPFTCDVCNKSFSRISTLNRHNDIHIGEKPFKCDVCNKSFSRFSTLNRHRQMHSGEKPFNCDVCNKSFSRFDNLKLHQRIHIGEKPFNCDICYKPFSRFDNLKLHQRIHSRKMFDKSQLHFSLKRLSPFAMGHHSDAFPVHFLLQLMDLV